MKQSAVIAHPDGGKACQPHDLLDPRRWQETMPMNMDANQLGYKGFKDYTPRFLKTYDKWVLGFMAPRVWKMGDKPALDLYRSHMGHRHLDVGPGTGYFITQTNPPRDIELTLVDPNPDVLSHCADTLAEWNPTMVQASVLEPLPIGGPFDSAALAHVIHCLPGLQALPTFPSHNPEESSPYVLTPSQELKCFGGDPFGPLWCAMTLRRHEPARLGLVEIALTRAFSGADWILTHDPLVAKDVVKTL